DPEVPGTLCTCSSWTGRVRHDTQSQSDAGQTSQHYFTNPGLTGPWSATWHRGLQLTKKA
ncbi:unnamed protein product, partial [Menidia menidia]